MDTSVVLSVEGLKKVYWRGTQEVTALRDVSLQIRSGEVLALLGPNGSGKTTTIQCIAGLVDPDAGSIRHSSGSWTSRVLGYVSSDAQFYWMFTGEQILKNYAHIGGVGHDRVSFLISTFNMEGRLKRRWHEYSSGEQMRIRLIRALLRNPDVMLFDEPTVGLDPPTAQSVRSVIRSLADDGKAVLITSHDMSDIEEVAHTVTFLSKGKTITTGTLKSFSRPLELVKIEYQAPPLRVEAWMKPVEEQDTHAFDVPLEQLAIALTLGKVRSVATHQENLESYFIRLISNEGGKLHEY